MSFHPISPGDNDDDGSVVVAFHVDVNDLHAAKPNLLMDTGFYRNRD